MSTRTAIPARSRTAARPRSSSSSSGSITSGSRTPRTASRRFPRAPAPGASALRLRVVGRAPADMRLARGAVRVALAHARLPREAEASIAIVTDAEMRGLNARHRGWDRVTDVLSFGATLPAGVRGTDAASHLERDVDGSVELGDIVIAAEQARRQARRRRWSVGEEIAFLAAHGALHLVGYEDDSQ